MNRVAGSLTTILAILALAILMPIGSVAAADCSLTVTPKVGPPGTEFVFKGKGFTPTTITLTRDGVASPPLDISGPTGTSSFKFSLTAKDSEVGKWRAVAAGCDAAVSIRVTLPPTATEASATTPPPPPDDTMQLAGLTLLGVLFLAATALLLPRLTRAARAG